jgi:hypothetical protein
MNQNKLFEIVLSKKAAELSGVAGESCCQSLHRSKIFRRGG